jgi:hypothetical protein
MQLTNGHCNHQGSEKPTKFIGTIITLGDLSTKTATLPSRI